MLCVRPHGYPRAGNHATFDRYPPKCQNPGLVSGVLFSYFDRAPNFENVVPRVTHSPTRGSPLIPDRSTIGTRATHLIAASFPT